MFLINSPTDSKSAAALVTTKALGMKIGISESITGWEAELALAYTISELGAAPLLLEAAEALSRANVSGGENVRLSACRGAIRSKIELNITSVRRVCLLTNSYRRKVYKRKLYY